MVRESAAVGTATVQLPAAVAVRKIGVAGRPGPKLSTHAPQLLFAEASRTHLLNGHSRSAEECLEDSRNKQLGKLTNGNARQLGDSCKQLERLTNGKARHFGDRFEQLAYLEEEQDARKEKNIYQLSDPNGEAQLLASGDVKHLAKEDVQLLATGEVKRLANAEVQKQSKDVIQLLANGNVQQLSNGDVEHLDTGKVKLLATGNVQLLANGELLANGYAHQLAFRNRKPLDSQHLATKKDQLEQLQNGSQRTVNREGKDMTDKKQQLTKRCNQELQLADCQLNITRKEEHPKNEKQQLTNGREQKLTNGEQQQKQLVSTQEQHKLLANGEGQHMQLATGEEQQKLLANGEGQHKLLANGEGQHMQLASGKEQHKLLTNKDEQHTSKGAKIQYAGEDNFRGAYKGPQSKINGNEQLVNVNFLPSNSEDVSQQKKANTPCLNKGDVHVLVNGSPLQHVNGNENMLVNGGVHRRVNAKKNQLVNGEKHQLKINDEIIEKAARDEEYLKNGMESLLVKGRDSQQNGVQKQLITGENRKKLSQADSFDTQLFRAICHELAAEEISRSRASAASVSNGLNVLVVSNGEQQSVSTDDELKAGDSSKDTLDSNLWWPQGTCEESQTENSLKLKENRRKPSEEKRGSQLPVIAESDEQLTGRGGQDMPWPDILRPDEEPRGEREPVCSGCDEHCTCYLPCHVDVVRPEHVTRQAWQRRWVDHRQQAIGQGHKNCGQGQQMVASQDQLVGSKGQLVGGQEQLVGSQGQLVGSQAQLVGSQGQLVGSQGHLLGSRKQLVGNRGQPRRFLLVRRNVESSESNGLYLLKNTSPVVNNNNNNTVKINNNNDSLEYKENVLVHQFGGLDLGMSSLNRLARLQSHRLADLQSSLKDVQKADIQSILRADIQPSLKGDPKSDIQSIRADLQSTLRTDLLPNPKVDHQLPLEADLKSSLSNDLQSKIQLNCPPPFKPQSSPVVSRSWRRTERLTGRLVTIKEDC